MSNKQILSTQAMAEQVNVGAAVPLLPEGVPGPMRYAGQWWAVPTAEDTYRPVPDPATIQRLDRHAARLAQAAATFHTRLAEGSPQ